MKPYQYALSEYWAEKEVKGVEDNPKIVHMFYNLGFDGSKLKDETSWCAAFVNHCLKETGHKHTGKLNARSFLELPGPVDEPELGDIVIFWRESPESWKGHVGFVIRKRRGWVYVLGGNQRNEVNIIAYQESRVLGYRRPKMDWGL